ncbi:unnamed protein product [Paramecium sonneborni]|uniref:Uncharacterized protein n=1 Tax=Paramecium sonneborni TaxID=65129 RepID=A0A8S1LC11_9CILI|nr:unnamed protein product [Paramecium sonneborni]
MMQNYQRHEKEITNRIKHVLLYNLDDINSAVILFKIENLEDQNNIHNFLKKKFNKTDFELYDVNADKIEVIRLQDLESIKIYFLDNSNNIQSKQSIAQLINKFFHRDRFIKDIQKKLKKEELDLALIDLLKQTDSMLILKLINPIEEWLKQFNFDATKEQNNSKNQIQQTFNQMKNELYQIVKKQNNTNQRDQINIYNQLQDENESLKQKNTKFEEEIQKQSQEKERIKQEWFDNLNEQKNINKTLQEQLNNNNEMIKQLLNDKKELKQQKEDQENLVKNLKYDNRKQIIEIEDLKIDNLNLKKQIKQLQTLVDEANSNSTNQKLIQEQVFKKQNQRYNVDQNNQQEQLLVKANFNVNQPNKSQSQYKQSEIIDKDLCPQVPSTQNYLKQQEDLQKEQQSKVPSTQNYLKQQEDLQKEQQQKVPSTQNYLRQQEDLQKEQQSKVPSTQNYLKQQEDLQKEQQQKVPSTQNYLRQQEDLQKEQQSKVPSTQNYLKQQEDLQKEQQQKVPSTQNYLRQQEDLQKEQQSKVPSTQNYLKQQEDLQKEQQQKVPSTQNYLRQQEDLQKEQQSKVPSTQNYLKQQEDLQKEQQQIVPSSNMFQRQQQIPKFQIEEMDQNTEFQNSCGHKITIQQLEQQLISAFQQKRDPKCPKCYCKLSNWSNQFPHLQIKVKEEINIYTLKKILKFSEYQIIRKQLLVAKCKNIKCNFFCFWDQMGQFANLSSAFCQNCDLKTVQKPY